MKKSIFISALCLFLIIVMSACYYGGNYTGENNNKTAIIEKIKLNPVSDNPCPTIDAPSSFYISARITTIGKITLDDISVTITDPNVVSIGQAELDARNDYANIKIKVSVIGDGTCDIYITSKDESIKSEKISICGMSMDGLADYVLDSGWKRVHTRTCESVTYIEIDDRKYITKDDFHYDYRMCDECIGE